METPVVPWQASDRICAMRLNAVLPVLVEAMERNGHLISLASCSAVPDGERRHHRPSSSARAQGAGLAKRATAETRARRYARSRAGRAVAPLSRRRLRPALQRPTDRVLHPQPDRPRRVPGWTAAVPLLLRDQSVEVKGVETIVRQLPVPMRRINSDNDSAFLDATLTA